MHYNENPGKPWIRKDFSANVSKSQFCQDFLFVLYGVYIYAKQKQPGCKKVRGQSEGTMVISDQKL